MFEVIHDRIKTEKIWVINSPLKWNNYTNTTNNVRFQVLTEASTKSRVFWDVLPFSQIDVDRRFRGACYLHHQGSTHIWNVSLHRFENTAVHPRKLWTSPPITLRISPIAANRSNVLTLRLSGKRCVGLSPVPGPHDPGAVTHELLVNWILLLGLCTYLTDCTEKSPSWEADSTPCPHTQEIACLLCDPRDRYRVHKSPPPVSAVDHVTPVRTPKPCFNITLSSAAKSQDFQPHLVHIFHLVCLNAPPVSPRSHHPNNIWCRVQTMVPLIMQFSPACRHFVPQSVFCFNVRD
jgi:hypothetical protein